MTGRFLGPGHYIKATAYWGAVPPKCFLFCHPPAEQEKAYPLYVEDYGVFI